MIRVLINQIRSKIIPQLFSKTLQKNNTVVNWIPQANYVKLPIDHHESVDEFMDRMECYFNRPDIDGWELRKGLNDLAGMDFVADPRVLLAAICACRRCNDYACTTRLLEMVKYKCADEVKTIYPYVLEQLEPALDELGIDTPEKMGYGLPELALEDITDMD